MTRNPVNERSQPLVGMQLAGRGQNGGALVAAEAEKVDEAVRFINERTILSGLELAKEVGEYILDTFFDGDYANFTDTSRSKSTSFRALLERDDLLPGGATVYRFVRISQQLKLLPSEVATRLTLTHHRALLALPDLETKEALARRALDEDWSSQVLETEVRKLLPKSRAGRKPTPALAKGDPQDRGRFGPYPRGGNNRRSGAHAWAGEVVGSGRAGGREPGTSCGVQEGAGRCTDRVGIGFLSVSARKHSPRLGRIPILRRGP